MRLVELAHITRTTLSIDFPSLNLTRVGLVHREPRGVPVRYSEEEGTTFLAKECVAEGESTEIALKNLADLIRGKFIAVLDKYHPDGSVPYPVPFSLEESTCPEIPRSYGCG